MVENALLFPGICLFLCGLLLGPVGYTCTYAGEPEGAGAIANGDIHALRVLIDERVAACRPDNFAQEVPQILEWIRSEEDIAVVEEKTSRKFIDAYHLRLDFFQALLAKLNTFPEAIWRDRILYNYAMRILCDGLYVREMIKTHDDPLLWRYMQCCLNFTLAFRRDIEPEFEQKRTVVDTSVDVPGTNKYPSGVDPSAVKEPELRRRYIEAIEKNEAMGEYMDRQKYFREKSADVEKRINEMLAIIQENSGALKDFRGYVDGILDVKATGRPVNGGVPRPPEPMPEGMVEPE